MAETIIIDVEAGEVGQDTILRPELENRFYFLRLEGRPLKLNTEWQLLPDGFKVLNPGGVGDYELILDQRFDVEFFDLPVSLIGYTSSGAVTQYPDSISFFNSSEAVYNEGTFDAGVPGSTVTVKGRYETAGGNAYITVTDGKRISYSGIVYMPKNVPEIKEGLEVTITVKRVGRTDRIIKQKVLQWDIRQMNAKIWV